MEDSGASLLVQLLPSLVLGLIYAWIVYVVARKRRVNPWVWVIPAIIPVIGLVVSAIFMLLSFISIFDRLNALETKQTFT